MVLLGKFFNYYFMKTKMLFSAVVIACAIAISSCSSTASKVDNVIDELEELSNEPSSKEREIKVLKLKAELENIGDELKRQKEEIEEPAEKEIEELREKRDKEVEELENSISPKQQYLLKEFMDMIERQDDKAGY